MKSYDIVGFTGDAAVFCPDCAMQKFGATACGYCPECGSFIYPDSCPVCLDCGYDFSQDNMFDNEGNEVHPVFACSEWDYLPCCDGCGEAIHVSVIS